MSGRWAPPSLRMHLRGAVVLTEALIGAPPAVVALAAWLGFLHVPVFHCLAA
jgi:hypothetical protein